MIVLRPRVVEFTREAKRRELIEGKQIAELKKDPILEKEISRADQVMVFGQPSKESSQPMNITNPDTYSRRARELADLRAPAPLVPVGVEPVLSQPMPNASTTPYGLQPIVPQAVPQTQPSTPRMGLPPNLNSMPMSSYQMPQRSWQNVMINDARWTQAPSSTSSGNFQGYSADPHIYSRKLYQPNANPQQDASRRSFGQQYSTKAASGATDTYARARAASNYQSYAIDPYADRYGFYGQSRRSQ